MTTLYVSTDGNNSSGNGSAGKPWRSINYAVREAEPGDEIVVRAGLYNESVIVSKNGSPGNYITVRSEYPGGAEIVPPAGKPGVHVNADYIRIEGFDISGSTTAGLTATGDHHIEVVNNIVHDNVSNGIFLGEGDYWLVEGNLVYGNAASGGSSGIHLKAAHNVTGSTYDADFRIVVRDNVAYENLRQFGATTDGNGIILDDFTNTQRPELGAYWYRTLVEDNITYSNSGRGIQVAWSDHATIRDNIAFHNNSDGRSGLWRGELSNMGSSDTTWIRNVAVSNAVGADNPAIANVTFAGDPVNTDVQWSDNTTFNGTPGLHSIYTNRGNSRPGANNNDLGVDPGLTLSGVHESGRDLVDFPYDPELTWRAIGGTSGADQLVGSAGHDSISGGGGADHLTGGGGHDVLVGGNGIDTLVGGAGDDAFVYRNHSTAKNGDVIADFADGDFIDLVGIDANTRSATTDQSFTFIGAAGFSGTPAQLRYANGVVSGDVNGDGVRDFFITIANGYDLQASDFLL